MTSAERSADRAAIMLSAGEASGDLHGGTLCRALRELAPGLHLTGMGGGHMAAAGMEVIVDPTGEATVGTSEALGRIPALYRAYRAMGSRLLADRPRALVLIDFPEFNLRLARPRGAPACRWSTSSRPSSGRGAPAACGRWPGR